jgi:hypothetical protein
LTTHLKKNPIWIRFFLQALSKRFETPWDSHDKTLSKIIETPWDSWKWEIICECLGKFILCYTFVIRKNCRKGSWIVIKFLGNDECNISNPHWKTFNMAKQRPSYSKRNFNMIKWGS